jgi:hypothetical protein
MPYEDKKCIKHESTIRIEHRQTNIKEACGLLHEN